MIGHEVQIPLDPAQRGGDQPRLRIVGQRGLDGRDLVQRVAGGVGVVAGIGGRAVILDDADVLRREDAGGGVGEVDAGVVQAAHRRPLLAQHVRIVAQVERDGGQFAQGHGVVANALLRLHFEPGILQPPVVDDQAAIENGGGHRAPPPRSHAGDHIGGLPRRRRVQPDFLRQIAEETERKGVDRDAGQRADVGLPALQQRVAAGGLSGQPGLVDQESQPDQAVQAEAARHRPAQRGPVEGFKGERRRARQRHDQQQQGDGRRGQQGRDQREAADQNLTGALFRRGAARQPDQGRQQEQHQQVIGGGIGQDQQAVQQPE